MGVLPALFLLVLATAACANSRLSALLAPEPTAAVAPAQVERPLATAVVVAGKAKSTPTVRASPSPTRTATKAALTPSTTPIKSVSPTRLPGVSPSPVKTATVGGATPTNSPQPSPTVEETDVPDPTMITGGLNQRLAMSDIAIAVTHVERSNGKGGYNAESGQVFVEITVSVENVSSEIQSVDTSWFEVDDADGNMVGDMQNDYDEAKRYSPNLFDTYDLDPGQKVENKILLLAVEQGQDKNLFLICYGMDNTVQVNLGLQ